MEDKNVEVVVSEETKNVGILSKVTDVFKKHGKKIAVGAAIATVGLIALGLKKRASVPDVDYEDLPVDDYVEA